MFRITDKSFVYTPSYDTDLRKKFRMIIEAQRKAALTSEKKTGEVRSIGIPMRSIAREQSEAGAYK